MTTVRFGAEGSWTMEGGVSATDATVAGVPSRVRSFASRFDDFDAFVAAVGAQGEVLPLTGGPFKASLTSVEISHLQVLHASVPAQLRRAGQAPQAGLIIPVRPTEGIVFAGHRIAPGEAVAVVEGSDIVGFWPRPVQWVSVGMSASAYGACVHAWQPNLPMSGKAAFPRLATRDLERLVGTLLAVTRLATASGERGTACPAESLLDDIEAAVARALCGIEGWSQQPRGAGAYIHVVRRADEYLREHLGRPIYTQDLAQASGVSARALHSAFAALHGCSPHAYLKRRRLMLVHRALRAASGATLVKTVALDHGFWHLGNFARDYRAMFGELPTTTVRAARRARSTDRSRPLIPAQESAPDPCR